MRWFSQQPYTQPEHLLVDHIHLPETLWQFIHSLLDIPFLLLPIAALFLLSLRGIRPCFLAIAAALQLGYLFLSIYPSHLRGHFPLEPALGDWVNVYGVFPAVFIHGTPTIFLSSSIRVLFTIVSLGGLLSLITLLLSPHPVPPSANGRTRVSWHPLIVLTAPFAVANLLLLIPRVAGAGITERYLLILLLIALPCLLRFCQDRVQPQFPALCILLVAVMAIFAITLTHNLFSLYRARVALVRELSAAGVPPTSVDNGWEYNVSVELQYAPYINNFRMALPPRVRYHSSAAGRHLPDERFRRIPPHTPRYGISFTPYACYGPAPFAPAHYSRWPSPAPGTLYVVRYIPIVRQ
jgi:hypothetical protein